jgi:hypothetical protein
MKRLALLVVLLSMLTAAQASSRHSSHSHRKTNRSKTNQAPGSRAIPAIRSESARSAFRQESPCPSTGKTTGKCPGYVVTHLQPLECNGSDAPYNMQWQTIAEAKSKHRTDANCKPRPRSSLPKK